MKLGKVEKQTLLYAVLKVYAKFIHDFFFYKKVTYLGVENIPKDKPILIAPNHQNALMDALAIIFAQKIQSVFLARSDIFQNPLIAKILFAFKILPVFRLRDGKEKLQLNDIIYKKTMSVLEHNRQVIIFPEAQHIDKKHVRPLKKGIQRIAFMLEERYNFEAEVQIIPTGIYYSNYWNFRSKLVVSFGKPITIKDFQEDYQIDPARTIVKFTEVLHEKMKEQVIHISDLENHDELDLLREINEKQILKELGLNKSPKNKLIADKETIYKADELKKNKKEEFNSLIQKVKDYAKGLKEHKLKDWIIRDCNKNNSLALRVLMLLVGSPFFIYGFLNNVIVYFLPRLITGKLKDRQFITSIEYVFSLFIFPIVYLLQAIAVGLIFKLWYVAAIYFITVPFFGLLAFLIHRQFVKTTAIFRFSSLKNKIKEEFIKKRDEITKILN